MQVTQTNRPKKVRARACRKRKVDPHAATLTKSHPSQNATALKLVHAQQAHTVTLFKPQPYVLVNGTSGRDTHACFPLYQGSYRHTQPSGHLKLGVPAPSPDAQQLFRQQRRRCHLFYAESYHVKPHLSWAPPSDAYSATHLPAH